MTPPGSGYPPILKEHRLAPGQTMTINGQGGPIEALTFLQSHGDIPSLGFRFGNVAYSTDLKSLPRGKRRALEGLDIWIVDALRKSATSEPFQSRGIAVLDRADQAKTRDPDRHAYRPGLRDVARNAAGRRRAGL